MPKITEMYAFVIPDKDENDEGIIGASIGPWMMPLVGADMVRVRYLKPIADAIVSKKPTHAPYKILKFKLVGEIDPKDL